RAQSTSARPLQLLRREWQLSESAATRRSDEACLVQVAVPSQPAQASYVGKVYGFPPTETSATPTDHGPDLEWVTRESHRRKSRMVEISLSGSGEGPGRVTSRPTLQRLLLRFERIQQRHYGMKLMAYTLINLRAFCGV